MAAAHQVGGESVGFENDLSAPAGDIGPVEGSHHDVKIASETSHESDLGGQSAFEPRTRQVSHRRGGKKAELPTHNISHHIHSSLVQPVP